MDTLTIFTISTISIGVLFIVINSWIDQLKQKYFSKGYADGQSEVVRSLKSTAFWFNAPEHKEQFNAMMLYSIIYQKYGRVDSHLFRSRINELGERKLHDLKGEELENLIR